MGQQQSQSKDEMLFQEVSNNNVEGIKSLHHEGAGLEGVDKLGRTPLILACTNDDLYDVAKTLLELGSNVNAYRSGCNGGTPLHHAAKRGLVHTVKLLLSHGANPLVLDDDVKTALEVARDEGYSNVVRAIESHICLFSGCMREYSGSSLLNLFAPQLLSRKVWVVVVPTGSRNPTKPLKLELVLYDSIQDAQPRMVIPLWKANLEEPKSFRCDDSVMIIDDSRSPKSMRQRRESGFISQARRWAQVDRQIRLKLAAEIKGDMKQMNWFSEACKGVPQVYAIRYIQLTFVIYVSLCLILTFNTNWKFIQPMNPPRFMKTSQATTTTTNVPALSDDALTRVAMSLPSPKTANKEDGLCVICVDAPSEAVCVPCGHVAGCISCLKEIENKKMGCPVCRANIDQVIKLYHV
jgi:hypothetical protein